jgi:putative transposase
MPTSPLQPAQEVIDFLNGQPESSPRRRKPHHLPDAHYSVVGAVYCVTMCSRHRAMVFRDENLSDGVIRSLRFYRDRGDFYLNAYCLMPDHLHFILQLRDSATPEENRIRRVIAAFKSYTTTKVAWPLGIHGVLWQRDWYDHIGRSYDDVDCQCRYVLNNPVWNGLAETWSDYPWSGAPDP